MPEPVRSSLQLALERHESGDFAEAARMYRESLRLDPTSIEAHNNLGNILQAENRLEEALTHFQEAARLRPDLAAVHYNLGNCRNAQGLFREAASSYRRALAIRPDLAIAHHSLGLSLQGTKDFAPA